MTAQFIQEQITATKALITAYNDAIMALVSNGVVSYTIDTGQNRQTVTRQDLKRLEDGLEGLYNRLATLEARLTGSGTAIARPAW